MTSSLRFPQTVTPKQPERVCPVCRIPWSGKAWVSDIATRQPLCPCCYTLRAVEAYQQGLRRRLIHETRRREQQ